MLRESTGKWNLAAIESKNRFLRPHIEGQLEGQLEGACASKAHARDIHVRLHDTSVRIRVL